MRRALIPAAVLAIVALGWTLSRGAGDRPGVLTAQTADAGGVEVTVTPVKLDGDAALFDVVLSTHTVELDLDLAGGVALVVGSALWGPARWEGDAAGGHHRSGRLAFTAQGPAAGAVQLSIRGLPAPVTFQWDLEVR